MIVDVARLAKGGERLRGETAPGLLELGESEFVTPVGGMAYDVRAEILGSELLVRGGVRQRLTCVCSRCAESFDTEVSDPEFVCSFEINATTDFVDLTEEVREAIILALPGYPVCREACQGLCMTCGANLNQTACQCRAKDKDNRWAALEALAGDLEEK
ncbi:MAG: DUF177 domain-containing protein [Verrucomicrobiota bacterium]|nr:DUF177 domain-containing protein [Verrucomicrobiota bacterium]